MHRWPTVRWQAVAEPRRQRGRKAAPPAPVAVAVTSPLALAGAGGDDGPPPPARFRSAQAMLQGLWAACTGQRRHSHT